MTVFDRSMNTLDTRNLPSCVKSIEDYIKYMCDSIQIAVDVLSKGSVLITDKEPGKDTFGTVGQIAVYNGSAYVCTSNNNNFTWVKIGG